MPVQQGTDKKGPFYRYGKSGKKYYYKSRDESSRKRAKQKATIQGYAIEKRGGK